MFDTRLQTLRLKFERLENELNQPHYFAGNSFSLVDAVFAPVFRYFDTFEKFADLHLFDGLVKVKAWRKSLAERASVRNTVAPNYGDLLYASHPEKERRARRTGAACRGCGLSNISNARRARLEMIVSRQFISRDLSCVAAFSQPALPLWLPPAPRSRARVPPVPHPPLPARPNSAGSTRN